MQLKPAPTSLVNSSVRKPSSPEEASPPEPLPGDWALPSEVSVSDQSRSSCGRGPTLEGTLGGWRDARGPASPSESSSELNGGVLSRRRGNEECVSRKEDGHSHTSPLASWLAQSQFCPWHSWAQTPARSHLQRGSHPLLEDEDPAPPGWQLGLGDESVRGLPWPGARDSSLFMGWTPPEAPPAHFSLPLTCLRKLVGGPGEGGSHTTDSGRMRSPAHLSPGPGEEGGPGGPDALERGVGVGPGARPRLWLLRL